jgi:predicted transcriptional regulator
MVKYRTRIEIMADILRLAAADGGVKKTYIMYEANLSHKLLNEYLDWLLKEDMLSVEKESKRNSYRKTAYGSKVELRIIEYLRDEEKVRQNIEDLKEERKALEREYGLQVK